MIYLRYLLAVLFLVPFVAGIGISPPTIYIDYEPGKMYDLSANIINYNDFPITVDVRTEGEFASRIAIKEPIRVPAQGATPVFITFTAPDSLDRPGHHTSYVTFTESYFDENTGTFGARTAVQLRISMWQPYPGHYAEIVASAQSVSEGTDSPMKVTINNLGVEPVVDATATVRVLSAQSVLQDVITITDIDLAGNTNTVYNRLLRSASYAPGRYTLQASLDYGTNYSAMNSTFVIGTLDVDALQLEGPFYLDKPVNRFSVHVESLWNLPVENVYAVVSLGSKISQTPSLTLEPFGKAALQGYWETDTTVPVGQVVAEVVLHFGGTSKEVLLPVTILATTPVAEVEEPTLVLSGADILFSIGVIVIVLCIVLFALNKHFHPPKEGHNETQ